MPSTPPSNLSLIYFQRIILIETIKKLDNIKQTYEIIEKSITNKNKESIIEKVNNLKNLSLKNTQLALSLI